MTVELLEERVARTFAAYGTREYPEWTVRASVERIALTSEVSPGNDFWQTVQDGDWKAPLTKEANDIARKVEKKISKFGLSVRGVHTSLSRAGGHTYLLMIEITLAHGFTPVELEREVEKAL